MKSKIGEKAMVQKIYTLSAVLGVLVGSFGMQDVRAESGKARESGHGLEEIIITAQKRAQGLQDTSVAVTAIGQTALTNNAIIDMEGLTQLVPAMDLNQGGDIRGGQLSLRGVSSTNFTEFGDSAVGVHIDGVVIARSEATNALLQDVERVEVLRGPQGTLFGRNSTAGTVNIIAKKPTEETGGYIGGVVGNYSRLGTKGMANIALSDSLAVRGSFMTDRHDGYSTSINSGISDDGQAYTGDIFAGRLSGLYTPSERLEIYAAVDYVDDTGNPGLGTPKSNPNPRKINVNEPVNRDFEFLFLRSQLTYNFTDNLAFSYLVGYSDMTQEVSRPSGEGIIRADFAIDNVTYSHELQLQYNTDKLQAVFGLYSFEEDQEPVTLSVQVGPGLYFEQPHRGADSEAIFGQATYAFTDRLRLTVGGRQTKDERFDENGGLYLCGGVPSIEDFSTDTCLARINDTTAFGDFEKFTYKTTLEWDTPEGNLIYAGISSGFKAGRPDSAAESGYGPENLVNYEAGFKFDLLDGRLRLNTSVFMMDFEDMQVNQLTVNDQGLPQGVWVNAGSAEIKGVEVEYSFIPYENGRLEGYFAYLDAKYKEFVDAVIPEDLSAGPQDFSGNYLPKAPEYSFSVAYSHNHYLSNGATIRPRLSVTWKDSYFIRESNLPIDYQSSTTLIDASLRYTEPSEAWYVEVFGKNLDDELIVSSLVGTGNPRVAIYQPPRTYGVQFQYNF